MTNIIAHTMEYIGDNIHTSLVLRKYTNSDFNIYKTIYEDCFWEMRTALQLTPVNCCDTKEQLNKKRITSISMRKRV
ncbi:hypothetical protein GOQ29_08795 [Clostridium sp. D2Q-14]|uniref:hypothetical protein n=1 Tax=Anaeromonas gelatinilytica TaxID=2683194 RepID=UPI00193C14F5|nr:hypothetical protein [Anaeromonas gelatinilytica]MBS4535711.1 hypothetical protein [Anaeromonas gelatinilytica]